MVYNEVVEQTTKRIGRPPGRHYTVKTTLYLKPADDALSRALAEAWSCSVAEMFRRAMREAARRERVTPPAAPRGKGRETTEGGQP
jgi:hypothetical protein